ncbi:MAG: hypothetical protein ACI9CF_001924 [Candidatus Omnitrophota bacterium]|jgi:hypothetical protein
MDDFAAAILGPFDMVKTKIAGFIPTLISVIIILSVGWFLAAMIQRFVVRFLKLARLDSVSEKSGISNVLLKGDIHQTLSEIVGSIIYWTMMLIVILTAVDAMHLTVAASLLDSVILYVPHVIAAVFILVLGIFFASVLATTVRTTAANYGIEQAKGLGKLAQVIIIIFTVVQALRQLQLDVTVFNLIIQATVAAIALGVGLAIGLGCKDMVGKQMQLLIDSFKSK